MQKQKQTTASSTARPTMGRDTAGPVGMWALGLVALLLMGIAGCTGSKALTKKGERLEAAGLYGNAADFYYNALLRKQGNVDARIGLSRTGQRVVDDKIGEFTAAAETADAKASVYRYLDLEAYRRKLSEVDIATQSPSEIRALYEDLKAMYLQALYDQGNGLLGQGNFAEAKAIFQEMDHIEPGYKDTRSLWEVSTFEPIYQAALSDFDAGRYRKAYGGFDQIFRQTSDYKETAVLRGECLTLGRYVIALPAFGSQNAERQTAQELHDVTLERLTAIDDPFVKIVDRDDLAQVLKEQRITAETTAGPGVVETGQATSSLLGADAVVTCTVLNYTLRPGKWKKTTLKGFEQTTKKIRDEETGKTTVEHEYKPVTYNRYSAASSTTLKVRYKAVSTRTGEVLFSGVEERVLSDRTTYAVFAGEITNLVPAGDDGPDTSYRARKDLLALLRADRSIKSTAQLGKEAMNFVAVQIARDLESHLESL